MTKYVAFIRAINVGTSNRIKMVDLATVIEGAGCTSVSWHLQTGNMLLEAKGSAESVAIRIEEALSAHGLQKTDVMLRTKKQLKTLVALDPFAADREEEFRFSVSFLRRPPTATPTERLTKSGAIVRHLDDTVLCLAVPRNDQMSGGASTVIDKPWGTPSTTRWWNVVVDITKKFESG
jgi:uncharacterized protein (DUF1697 family)